MTLLARTPDQVGIAVRRYRRQKHLSQSQLGEATGLRQATISAVENGEAGTSLRTLCDILAALDLELIVQPRTQAKRGEIEALF